MPIPSPYLSLSVVPSEELTFIPTSVFNIFLKTICEAVEDDSDYRNIMLWEYKDYLLEHFKYLMSVVNTVATDVVNK